VNLLSSMPVATKAQQQVSGSYQDYDVGLLTSAPVATKPQLYKPDLLIEKAVPPTDSAPVERGDHGQPIPPRVPFYLTGKGIIIIAVAFVVVIAVAVGGGVAGSKKKKTTQDSDWQSARSGAGTLTTLGPTSGDIGSSMQTIPYLTKTITTTTTSGPFASTAL